MKTKIAVVMPVYNAERFLRGSLDSILNQEISDIKVICINDKSQDRSLEILKEYEQKDDRVIVLNNEENKGAGKTEMLA